MESKAVKDVKEWLFLMNGYLYVPVKATVEHTHRLLDEIKKLEKEIADRLKRNRAIYEDERERNAQWP